MNICKFCGRTTAKSYGGYCQVCYTYFTRNKYEVFPIPEYGKMSYVEDIGNKQYGMPICHICGKAFDKLQQHIWYVHCITKRDYCVQFGLDNKVRLTSLPYHNKMRDYAFRYDMDKQVKQVGKGTRFTKGNVPKYLRSAMTMNRLKDYGRTQGYKNLKKYENGGTNNE